MDLTSDQIQYLLTLPPQGIIKWFYSKGYNYSWNWQDTWQDAHVRSYTVAKIMKLDILQSLKDETDKIFSKGITYQQFLKDLEPTLKELGWWGKVRADQVPGYDPNSGTDSNKIVELGTPRRLKTIFQTNSNVVYNSARYKFQVQNAVSRPYWLYVQIHRPTYRKEHALYDGKVFMWDDPIWDKIYPPNGFNCGCYVVALTQDEFEARGLKLWKGSQVRVDVADGWDYNPGKTLFEPDLNQYDSDLRAVYEAIK